MSDKNNGHDIEKRLRSVEVTTQALKKVIVDNGKTVDARLAEQRTALLNLDKKMDRILTVSVDAATKVNLMQRQNIHAQETCHPMIIIQDHLKDHEKEDKAKQDQQDRIEKRGLSRWQKIGITAGASTGIASLVFTVVRTLLGKQ